MRKEVISNKKAHENPIIDGPLYGGGEGVKDIIVVQGGGLKIMAVDGGVIGGGGIGKYM